MLSEKKLEIAIWHCVQPSPTKFGSAPAPRPPLTARHNWRRGWIASPGLTRAKARPQADIYRERCVAYGRQPNETQAVLQHALAQGCRGIPPEALIAGSVDEVAGTTSDFRGARLH
jgi:hypothetical protein